MRGAALFVLLGFVVCATADGATPASASFELLGWQTAAGKPPSKAEFAALLAACEDRAKCAEQSGPIDGCLSDLGLRRVE